MIKMLKRNFENNKETDLYNEILKKIKSKSNGMEYFLLKDERTKFVLSNVSNKIELENIKYVYLLLKNKDLKIKIKGHLSLNKFYELEFFPLFIDKSNTFERNCDFWYKLNPIKENEYIEKITKTKELMIDICKNLKKSKYTHISSDSSWKNFIEPYEYYVELKLKLIEEKFVFMEGFGDNGQKVIALSTGNKEYKNFSVNKLFEKEFLNNRGNNLFVDYDKYNNKFDTKFIRENSGMLISKRNEYEKNEYDKAEKIYDELNKKLKNGIKESSFFRTKETYTKKDIKKNIQIGKNDEKIDVSFAFLSEISDRKAIIENNIFKTKKTFEEIKEIKEIKSAKEVFLLINDIKKNIDLTKKIKKGFSDYSKTLSSNIENISDNEKTKAKETINEINSVNINEINIDILLEMFNEYDYDKKEIINKYNNKIKKIEENINNLVKGIKNKSKLEIENINKERNENEKEKEVLEKKLENDLVKIEENFIDSKNFKIEINKLYVLSQNNKKIIKNIVDIVTHNVFNIITYYFDINIIYSVKNESTVIGKPNIYLLNTGDLVLMETINKIVRKVKKSNGLNHDVLNKIIGKEKMVEYKDKELSNDYLLQKSYHSLNDSQKEAFNLAIDETDSIAIIQGPPGTGKTKVITEICKYYRMLDKKVIVSSQTNVAIKNVIDKLSDFDKISESVITPWLTFKVNEPYSIENISNTWYEKIISNFEVNFFDKEILKEWNSKRPELKKDDEIFKDITLSKDAKIFGATTTTSVTLEGKEDYKYIEDAEILIIDEVSKSILPEILRYALDVKKVILVGDYKQLNPIFDIDEKDFDEKIDSEKFRKLRKIISSGIFYELSMNAKSKNRVKTLNVNYRSVPGVLDAYNVFYKEEGGLKPHRKFEEYSDNYKYNLSEYFDSKHSMYFFNIEGSEERTSGTSKYNILEIDKMIDVLEDLGKTLIDAYEKNVAIIFPYAAQINHFVNKIKTPRGNEIIMMFKNVEWNTVDSFQGSEANIVLLSTVITTKATGFMSDFRRINVALSRAKEMLLIFGKKDVLRGIEIKGEGITTSKYFQKILNTKENKYLLERTMIREDNK